MESLLLLSERFLRLLSALFAFFFFNDTATTEIYTLSLHDALPISFGHRSRTLQMGYAREDWEGKPVIRSEEHTSELQSQSNLVCRLLLEKKNTPLNSPAAISPSAFPPASTALARSVYAPPTTSSTP